MFFEALICNRRIAPVYRLPALRHLPHQPGLFPVPIAVFLVLALVVELFAFCQADFDLYAPLAPVQVEWNQGEPGALDLADQAGNLLAVKQQFAGAGRVGLYVGGGAGQRSDVHAKDEQFFAARDDVGFLDVSAPSTDGFHFPAFKHESGLEPFFDEEIMMGFAVLYDAHG